MNPRLQSAFNLEESRDYKGALEAYLALEQDASVAGSLSAADRLFLARSIAACYYYLKNYAEAESRFVRILSDEASGADSAVSEPAVRSEIETCLYLCWLYGGSADKAKSAFSERVSHYSYKDGAEVPADELRARSWNCWYLGQCNLLLDEYADMAAHYDDAVFWSERAESDKVVFFMCHLVVADLLNDRMDDAGRLLNRLSFMQGKSFGLFKIAESFYKKKRGQADWKKEYTSGVKEAKKHGYAENVELGEFLLKKFS